MMDWFFVGMACLLAGAFLVPFVPAQRRPVAFTLVILLSAIAETLALAPVFSGGGTVSSIVPFGWPLGDALLRIDRLSAFFLLVIAWLGLPALVVSGRFTRMDTVDGARIHWFFLGMLFLAMKLAIVLESLIHFLVVWEIMSLSSFFLVLMGNSLRRIRSAGLHYFVAMHISVVFLMLGAVVLGGGGFTNLHGTTGLSFLFLMTGFAFKMGLVPFHSWVPEAYPAASPHVSAIMSALMSKLGVYGMLRAVMAFGPSSEVAAWIVVAVGSISAVSGITFAVIRRDLKEILAYSSMENLGIITAGIGVMMLGSAYSNTFMLVAGIAAVLVHTICHSLYKIVLFTGAGLVEYAGAGRDLETLGGLARRMPRIAGTFFCMAWASASLPPFGGLISEILLVLGLVAGLTTGFPLVTTALVVILALVIMTGAVALLAWTRIWGIAFSGEPRSAGSAETDDRAVRGWAFLWIPVAVLLFMGLFPAVVFDLLLPFLDTLSLEMMPIDSGIGLWPLVRVSLPETLLSFSVPVIAFVAVIGFLLMVRAMLLRGRRVVAAATWACGWQKPDPSIQYTADSFSDPFVSVVRPVLHTEYEGEAVRGFFPESAGSNRQDDDPIRRKFVSRLGRLVDGVFARFAWIQSGNMQQYILYGLLWLSAMITWILVVA